MAAPAGCAGGASQVAGRGHDSRAPLCMPPPCRVFGSACYIEDSFPVMLYLAYKYSGACAPEALRPAPPSRTRHLGSLLGTLCMTPRAGMAGEGGVVTFNACALPLVSCCAGAPGAQTALSARCWPTPTWAARTAIAALRWGRSSARRWARAASRPRSSRCALCMLWWWPSPHGCPDIDAWHPMLVRGGSACIRAGGWAGLPRPGPAEACLPLFCCGAQGLHDSAAIRKEIDGFCAAVLGGEAAPHSEL